MSSTLLDAPNLETKTVRKLTATLTSWEPKEWQLPHRSVPAKDWLSELLRINAADKYTFCTDDPERIIESYLRHIFDDGIRVICERHKDDEGEVWCMVCAVHPLLSEPVSYKAQCGFIDSLPSFIVECREELAKGIRRVLATRVVDDLNELLKPEDK